MKLTFNAKWYSRETWCTFQVVVCEKSTDDFFQIFLIKIGKFVFGIQMIGED